MNVRRMYRVEFYGCLVYKSIREIDNAAILSIRFHASLSAWTLWCFFPRHWLDFYLCMSRRSDGASAIGDISPSEEPGISLSAEAQQALEHYKTKDNSKSAIWPCSFYTAVLIVLGSHSPFQGDWQRSDHEAKLLQDYCVESLSGGHCVLAERA